VHEDLHGKCVVITGGNRGEAGRAHVWDTIVHRYRSGNVESVGEAGRQGARVRA
jgi:hypothetical protein